MRHSFFSKGLLAGLIAVGTVMAAPAWANPSILFDLNSGKVLEHQDAFKRWHPASLTKLMTAYVTFRAIDAGELTLQSPIKVTKKSAAEPPSKMGYKPGSVMTLDNALKMMLIKSANDIAYSVGENVGGSIPAFADRMNAEAARLGMTGSHFTNANGLHDPLNYTTARDLAILVRAIRTEYPQYASYFAIEGLSAGKKVLKSFNLLVGRYPGADGMKTGFVCASGFNMIGSATRNGRTLVAVVLGEKTAVSRAETAANLLNQGFATPEAGGNTVATLPVYGDPGAAPLDIRDEICPKKPAASAAAPSEDAGEQTADGPKSIYLQKLDHEPRLVAVGLGGATGPVPKAFAAIAAQNYADVPIPTWRPDRPVPSSALAAQGDSQ